MVSADGRRSAMAGTLAAVVRDTVRQQVRNKAWPGVLLDG